MKKYELVVVLDGRTSQEERDTAIAAIEAAIDTNNIVQKDEIGAMDAEYDLARVKGNNKIYLISYYLNLVPEAIREIEKKIAYIKPLKRHFFYAMTSTQPFFTFKELQKKFEEQEEEASSEEESN